MGAADFSVCGPRLSDRPRAQQFHSQLDTLHFRGRSSCIFALGSHCTLAPAFYPEPFARGPLEMGAAFQDFAAGCSGHAMETIGAFST